MKFPSAAGHVPPVVFMSWLRYPLGPSRFQQSNYYISEVYILYIIRWTCHWDLTITRATWIYFVATLPAIATIAISRDSSCWGTVFIKMSSFCYYFIYSFFVMIEKNVFHWFRLVGNCYFIRMCYLIRRIGLQFDFSFREHRS